MQLFDIHLGEREMTLNGKCNRQSGPVSLKLLLIAPLMAILANGVVQADRPYIHVGRQSDLLDQPSATIEMTRDDGQGGITEIGPYDSGFGIYPYSSWLLDTGANSAVAISDAAAEMVANGMFSEGVYYEQGVAGYQELYISAAAQILVTGTTGDVVALPQTDHDVRILYDPSIDIGDWPASLGGISGIFGMPAMIGRVTTLDFSSWIGLSDFWELLDAHIDVKFPTSGGEPLLPAGNGHRYSVSVDTRITYSPDDGLPPGADPDITPVWAPVPFLTAEARAHDAQGNPTSYTGDFLFDTGAQMSLITREMAFALGLDEDGDGTFQQEMFGDVMQVGGIGGTVDAIPLLIDEIRLRTDQGVDLVWAPLDPEDIGLQVLVLPEDATQLPFSIFGIDFVAGGLIVDYDTFDIEGNPYFEQVYLDFRALESEGTGKIYFDLSAEVDNVVYEIGDANGDGVVNELDATIMAANWLATDATWAQGDFNGDGTVNAADAALLAENWMAGMPSYQVGDANRDGAVDADDAAVLAANWLCDGAGWSQGDFNGDGLVDDIDATMLAANWGYGATGAAVPEPDAVILLLTLCLAIVVRLRLCGGTLQGP